ncbi:pleckstrin homology domain-containing family S member 1-like [Mustelus asterias]
MLTFKMAKKGGRLSAVFYVEPEDNQNGITGNDICFEGYLTKSPPNSRLGIQSSWKKRYFVLTEKNSEHTLNYFKYREDSRKSPPLGKILIKGTTKICSTPGNHEKWNLIQKMFKCTSDSVLLLKTEERDYFFIGDIEPMLLWNDVIEKILQVKTTPQSEEQTEGSFGKPSSRNQSDPIYASISEVVESNAQKFEWINSKSLVESPSSEKDNNIYDNPKLIKNRLSQPKQSPVNTEKPRTYSLPTQLEGSEIYDTPRSFLTALKRERAESSDSGIYMPMASIRDSTSTNASIDISEQIDEEEEYLINETSNDMEETKQERLDVIVCQDDIKNLQFEQVNEKVLVRPSDKKCPFNVGDQVLAINKLKISDVKEVNMFVSKSMEQEMTVTVLRRSGAAECDNEECH